MNIRNISLAVAFLLTVPVMAQKTTKQKKANKQVALPVYKQAAQPTEARVADLISRMTVEEKIGQLVCPLGWEMYTKTGKNSVEPSELFKKKMDAAPIGSFWAVLRADPWTQKTLETGLNPELSAKALNALQRYAVEKTRLGIPILFAEECPHGHMAIGTTVFPTSLNAASTWNPSLLYDMGSAIGLEAAAQGSNIGYGPVLDVAREPRWSRMEETFGEDPWLTSVLGTAVVRGMQGDNSADKKHVICTLKHLAAYGVPEGGHNGGPVYGGERLLRSQLLLPFETAVRAGAGTVMTSYNSIDGVPCTSNRHLLTDMLRGEWGFKGFVYSDLLSVEGIAGMGAAANNKEAAVLALKAGLDMDLGGGAFGNNLKKALDEGLVTMADIDRAVANVLTMKFNLGLFDNPYVQPKRAREVCRSAEHKQLAQRVAAEGTVLLKNDGVLPLSRSMKRIAVIGPNADMPYNQLSTTPLRRLVRKSARCSMAFVPWWAATWRLSMSVVALSVTPPLPTSPPPCVPPKVPMLWCSWLVDRVLAILRPSILPQVPPPLTRARRSLTWSVARVSTVPRSRCSASRNSSLRLLPRRASRWLSSTLRGVRCS